MKQLAIVAMAGICLSASAADVSPKPDPGPLHTIEFDTEEGTWMHLDVSPDGRSIIFDLLGDLYTLPIGGGEAKRLRGGRSWDMMARYSPDGKSIAYVSDEDGEFNLWVMDVGGSNPRQLSQEHDTDVVLPEWTPDSREVIAVRRTYEASLWVYPVGGGTGFALMQDTAGSFAEPALSPDGRHVYFTALGSALTGRGTPSAEQIRRLDRLTGETVTFTSSHRPSFRPEVSPDGKYLAYARNEGAATALRIRDLKTGAERELLRPITRDLTGAAQFGLKQGRNPLFAFTPDSAAIVIASGGKIYRVEVANGRSSVIPFRAHVSVEAAEPVRIATKIDDADLSVRRLRWTSFSQDGKAVAFSALGKMWIQKLPGGVPKRLTASEEQEYSPAISPDGRKVVYASKSDRYGGHLKIVPATGGPAVNLLEDVGFYINPTWSADGSKIAYLKGSNLELRQQVADKDPLMEIQWLALRGARPQPQTVTHWKVSTWALQDYSHLTFNAQGTRIYYMEQRQGGPNDLVSIRLDGLDRKRHLTFTQNIDSVLPSPDEKHAAVVDRTDVWVVDLPPYGPAAGIPVRLGSPASSLVAKQVSRDGASYVGWLGPEALAYSFANRLYRWQMGQDSAQLLSTVELKVPRARPSGSVAYVDARIVTMKGDEVIARGTVLVRDNRIVAVGPSEGIATPTDAWVVNVAGKTIVPGLVDTHAHVHLYATDTAPEEKWEYMANLAYGVTTNFDPSAPTYDMASLAERVEAGDLAGPRIYGTGTVVQGRGLNSPDQTGFVDIRGVDDARRIVKRHKDLGALMIKSYMQPRRDQRQWLAQACRELGLQITAEGAGDQALDLTFAMDGYSAFEHNFSVAPMYRDQVEFFARSGTFDTPVLAVPNNGADVGTENYFFGRYVSDAKLRRFTPALKLDSWTRRTVLTDDELYWVNAAETAHRITQAGGLIAMGAHGNTQGLGMHWETWALAMGGYTPMEALRAATLTGAMKLGMAADLGSIEPGKMADFIVLNANPLDDIRNTEKIQWVAINGFVYDAESMTQVYPRLKERTRPSWLTEEEWQRYRAPAPVRFETSP